MQLLIRTPGKQAPTATTTHSRARLLFQKPVLVTEVKVNSITQLSNQRSMRQHLSLQERQDKGKATAHHQPWWTFQDTSIFAKCLPTVAQLFVQQMMSKSHSHSRKQKVSFLPLLSKSHYFKMRKVSIVLIFDHLQFLSQIKLEANVITCKQY